MAPTPGPIPGTVGPIVQDHSNFLITPRKGTSVSTKGLLNMPGQNNCFLNSAVQVLWHLDSFRRNFRELSGHACMAESCIFCALKELFTQFQYSQESALPPDALRHALAKTFCDQRRFQLGFMDDAAECFENILLRIHVHIANQDVDDICGNLNCIPHQKFAMTLVEQRMCQNCSAASEPLPFTQMVHYVTTSALCTKAIELMDEINNTQLSPFGDLLRLAGEMGEVRECPSGCGGKIQARKTLMNHPEVVSIGLVWDSECPTLQHITDVFHSIGLYLRLQDMFHNVCDHEWANVTTHQLVGVVTYYGKHYSTFFFHTKLRVWIYFDDATVREVGPSWEQVVEKCQRGRFQPLLLLFANPESSFPSTNRDNLFNSSTTCDSVNKSPVMNQRQAVINQYLKFQNCQVGSYSKPSYGLTICAKGSEMYTPTYESQLYNTQRMPDHGFITKNTGSAANSVHYSYERAVQNQTQNLPMYSNLEYLNSLQHKSEHNVSKLNQVCLPMTNQSIGVKGQELQMYDDLEIMNKDKDFDASKDSDSAFTEEDAEVNDMYISRKAVESVLNLQKRQMTLCRSYSQSAIGNRNSSSSLESFDNVQTNKSNPMKNSPIENGPMRRDSGSWSSDRNSSASNNSAENSFLAVVTSKRLLLGLNKKLPLQDTNSSDHGYDSFSVSSSDSYPSVNGSPVKVEPRLTQIPEDWLPEDDTNLNQKLKLITEDDSGPPDCDKLCAEADLLLAKSHEKEKDGDLVMAALLSDSAAARARAAMEAPYNNSKSLVSAKMKHSTCVMRSSNLYRRLKDHELDERRKQKSHNGHHSRQSSRDSTHSKHSRQNSKDSSHSKSKDSNHTSDEGDHFGKNIEIYGTLPKKGSRKKASAISSSTKANDDQIYKDFLDKQRKNTSLSEALNETMLKNVDQPKKRIDSSPKRKNHSNIERKSFEGVPTKSPTRKKDSPPKNDPDLKKKSQKQPQPTPVSYLNNRNSSSEFNRDLLSPISSPEKKQHKIKRKLMGGFMKRKNRSLPDLREDQTSTNPMDCFLDDAIIEVPSNLTNGKPKNNPSDTKTAKITRGFHPHHAFVKKDLAQRPLLMKVNPPNIQLSALPNPKTKLIHTLPSIPKKPQENKIESSYNPSSKPSKIPFMTNSQKSETNLPPLPAYKPVDNICSRPAITQKSSAIPVLTPQIPLSPIKSSYNLKEQPTISNSIVDQQSGEQMNDLELPQPTNSFLAEIQAKRKQVLHKSLQKQELSHSNANQQKNSHSDKEELSMLPKLAAYGEGTSWLKELQSKQQQILSKQDCGKQLKPNFLPQNEPIKPQIPLKIPDYVKKEQSKPSQKNWKLLPESISEVDRVSTPISNASSSSVKNLASRFEKVLKPKTISAQLTHLSQDEVDGNKSLLVKTETIKDNLNINIQGQNLPHESSPKIDAGNVPLKSALKIKSDANFSKGSEIVNPIISDSTVNTESKPKTIKSALKSTAMPNPTDLHTLGLPNIESSAPGRPNQPPDYATALQRIGMIRTSTSDCSFPTFDQSTVSGPPKKKQSSKKTVTFSDEVVLVACAEYDEIDFSSNPLFERVYQQHVESGKGEIAILSNSYGNAYPADSNRTCGYDDISNSEAANSNTSCNLCHTKQVISPKVYCVDCEFYLSRFKPSNS